jgi:hypothetical protein
VGDVSPIEIDPVAPDRGYVILALLAVAWSASSRWRR